MYTYIFTFTREKEHMCKYIGGENRRIICNIRNL